MRNTKFSILLMALVAMSFFKAPHSFAQNEPRAFTPKIKTPNTSKELNEDRSSTVEDSSAENEPAPPPPSSAAPRRLQQHGIGIGLGQTFLFGNYGKLGDDKITLDFLYSYAASYSFDLLVNAHLSKHESEREEINLMGLSGSFKGRFVEYDNLSPFFLGGLGFYAPQATRNVDGDYKKSDRKLTFGLNFGAGVDLRLNERYVVGIMGQMHWPFRVQQDDQPDLKGYYMKLLITGMYLF